MTAVYRTVTVRLKARAADQAEAISSLHPLIETLHTLRDPRVAIANSFLSLLEALIAEADPRCPLCHGTGEWSEDHRGDEGRGPRATSGLCNCGAVRTDLPGLRPLTAGEVLAREAEFDAIRAANAA